MSNSDPSYITTSRASGLVLEFQYMGAKENTQQAGVLRPKSVKFSAMLKSISDQYESSWESEDVWGRMDGIYNYQNTKRKYNLTWDIPAWDLAEAKDNLRNVGILANFLYPGITSNLFTKSDTQGGQLFKANITDIKSQPILTLKYGNLIRDVNTGGGLYGFIDGGFSVNMKVEQGMFAESWGAGEGQLVNKGLEAYHQRRDYLNLYPKMIELSISYRVLHSHKLGFDIQTNQVDDQSVDMFPYGLDRNVILNQPQGELSEVPEEMSPLLESFTVSSDWAAVKDYSGDGGPQQSIDLSISQKRKQEEDLKALEIDGNRSSNYRSMYEGPSTVPLTIE